MLVPTQALSDKLVGFWRLRLTNEDGFATGGLTGFGSAPYSTVAAHFQLFASTGEYTAQVVELIGNGMLGRHELGALKGEFAVRGTTVEESYPRLEFANTPNFDEGPTAQQWTCTYLGDRLRICRLGDESLRVYERQDAQEAQREIARMLEVPVGSPRMCMCTCHVHVSCACVMCMCMCMLEVPVGSPPCRHCTPHAQFPPAHTACSAPCMCVGSVHMRR